MKASINLLTEHLYIRSIKAMSLEAISLSVDMTSAYTLAPAVIPL